MFTIDVGSTFEFYCSLYRNFVKGLEGASKTLHVSFNDDSLYVVVTN